ncbi:nicotinate-nucleotide--dimethylbenzimidazole phosphoribosyltransferase [Micromonospora sp. R77]|uniref:nicotinate-nucleotide--dimethylbenzimidazole phosphoribosyltransferase n=1 Tax=Micromonospora sp. R77 TaxID=2925836 RepID=UPI001F60404F|nr:nicotinate-nucleotide--dimethylbenzimidazole phosphoribosyltransferase [Micromonospora sp. R77]MCI4061892.1 nicotinate-nucleotide--dimethylbenzimidazole phosphoribosyltransferase [Micromonospora sp. R77]
MERLATLDVPGAGLGLLDRVVGFAAATQGTATPPVGLGQVLLLHGDHTGGAAAGTAPGESARRARQAAPVGVSWPGWPPRTAPASRWWTPRPPPRSRTGRR